MTDLAPFIALIRRNARQGIWSQGVTLSRDGAVAVESQDADEIVLRVKARGRAVAPVVVLYPGEREWDCDCGSRMSPCEHVAAAAIALSGSEEGRPTAAAVPPVAEVWGRLVYRFARDPGGLRLERAIAWGNEEKPLVGTLSGLLSKPAAGANIQPEQHDLQADLLLETGARAVLPPTKVDALMRVLVGARDVRLDGVPVSITEEQILPRALVEDAGDEVVVRIDRDPRVLEVLSPAVALCREGVIGRLGESELTGGWLQNLPVLRSYRPAQIGELATEIVPDLSRRMAVEVRTRRVPPVVRDLEPRIVLDLGHLGDGLTAMATLVYGVPPCVRIDEGRMVYLRGPVPIRAEDQERRLIHKLRDELDLLPGRRVKFDARDAATFASKLRRFRGTLTGDAADIVSTRARLVPQLQVGSEGGATRFDMRFAVVAEGGDAAEGAERFVEAAAVVRAWQEGLGLVPLDGGGWAPLPLAWLAKHGEQVADLLAARESNGQVANHALPALGALCADLDQPPPPGLDRLAPLVDGFSGLGEAPLPGDLTATLRPYQRRGVDWLTFLRQAGLGGVLADDMGLGKTIQVLGVLKSGERTLVVCPTSVLPNWQREIERFRPGLKVCAYHGPQRTLDAQADVVLTSYALLRLDGERLQSAPGPDRGRRWDLVVLDEAQAIKNPESQVARAAFSLSADCRLALSGTPVENRLDELWSLLHFTNRGLLGGRRSFEERFGRPIAEGLPGVAESLRRKIKPFILRRQKKEVAPELPPRSEMVLSVELDQRERDLYDAVRAATRADVVALLDGGGSVMKALEALLRLRQAACHTGLLPGQGGGAPVRAGGGPAGATSSSKVERLMEALELAAADGHKALVFSQWTSLLDLIEPRLTAAGLGFTRLDGSTRDRGEVVNLFQSAAGPPVMLISLKAGGVGLNLTAADHVFLCDPWWNPAVEAQAADRVHRIGQDKPVMVYRLVSLGTVEERILGLQEKKRALFDAALGDGAAATGLTRGDLLELLG